jgi:hypothetical protein
VVPAALRPWTLVVLLLFVAVPPARAAEACGSSGYSYAGFEAAHRGHGVRAELRVETLPAVEQGHVAGWIGVGGFGVGPGGSDEWLQVGLAAFEDDAVHLYYEAAEPRRAPRYVELSIEADPARSIRVALAEIRGRPSWWQVWVSGRKVGGPVFLPGSHGAWRPIVTAESWGGELSACNHFGYRFERVRIMPRGRRAWTPATVGAVFRDRGYRFVRAGDSFTALGPA